MAKAIQPPFASVVRGISSYIARSAEPGRLAKRAERTVAACAVVTIAAAIFGFAFGLHNWFVQIFQPIYVVFAWWLARKRYRDAVAPRERSR